MTVIADPLAADRASSRQERLASRARALRRRAANAQFDRWLQLGGAISLVVGFAVIGLGWAGAANTVFVFQQVPYLISGGVLGLAFVFIGAFAYFAYWMSQAARESRAQALSADRRLANIERLLTDALGSGVLPGASNGRTTGQFVATSGGNMYHRADCPVVAGKDELQVVDPASTDREPCRICEPDAVALSR